MKKKSFWARTNRGFWVSMVLLAAVLLYILVTQLMLIPQRGEIEKLGESVKELWEKTTLLTDEQVAKLKEPAGLQAETDRLAKELEPLFTPESDYLKAGTDSMLVLLDEVLSGNNRTKARRLENVHVHKLNIQEDTATLHVSYQYKSDGDYFWYTKGDRDGGSIQTLENITESLDLSFVCKRIDGQWKLFRISSTSTHVDDGKRGGYGR